ncbi:hypothetical protein [Treponema pectinovorum]|uniref:hypothetical protein n=1 Tax=Treponema pectinovorum TaxID=164 RepID=UPI003D8D485E
MKNTRFFTAFLFSILMSLTGCNYFFEHDFSITNNSSHEAHFSILGYSDSEYSLPQGNSITLKLYDNPKLKFLAITENSITGIPRIAFNTGVSSIQIFDLEKHTYKVFSSCQKEIVLTEARGYLGNPLSASYRNSITISPNATVEICVYTQFPQWNATYKSGENKNDALGFLSFTKKE